MAIAALAACSPLDTRPLAPLAVDFQWQATDRCSSQAPAFRVTGVPDTTRTLVFSMQDLDAPSYPHGGGRVAYSGSGTIPAGAFAYVGPCPPAGSHRYEFTVTARDAAGAAIARGQAMREFPPR